MTGAEWYFDFVSPYAYLGSLKVRELSASLELSYRPVLFAGLLNHWGQKGPAEITPKREWTYRWCTWWAQQHDIPFCVPAAHPFNPIPYLRLAIAADCTPAAIGTIFAGLWSTGNDAGDPRVLADLAEQLGVNPASLREQAIKDALRQRTEEAIGHGVFGVPTLRIGEYLFWGSDANEFIEAFLADPTLFDTAEMRRLGSLPVGAARRETR